MDGQAVEDEEDLPLGVPDQAGEEAEQVRCLTVLHRSAVRTH
jgi:hypothetical protein